LHASQFLDPWHDELLACGTPQVPAAAGMEPKADAEIEFALYAIVVPL
jgi:hypothetical protein